MTRKKTVELVEDTHSPKALILNGADISSILAKTLADRGCSVAMADSYSLAIGRFDYIFLFDNQPIADKLFENHLTAAGKFILVETKEELKFPFKNKFRVLRIGDPAFWNPPELVEKILHAIFSGSGPSASDISRKPAAHTPRKKETVTQREEILPVIEKKYIPIRPNPVIPAKTVLPPLLEKTHRFNFGKIFKIMLAVVVIFILIVSGTTYWYFNRIQKTISNLEFHFKTADLDAVGADFREARQEIKTAQNVYGLTVGILFPLKNISYVADTGKLLDTGERVVTNSEDFILYLKNILPAKSGFTQVTDNISREKLTGVKDKVALLAAVLVDAQSQLDSTNLPYLPKDEIKAALSPLIAKLTAAYDLLPVLERIFWEDRPKIYLVLLQNNMELRPTGGFIGSFGLLTITGGKITDFKIEDVYAADGQLKGHVDPPLPIRKYLSQPNFFLRDSNFDPDFAASAAQAAWFLQKEFGKNVDGVIGVNLTLAQKLMQVVGPIKLSDFGGEEITADNFFYKVHYLTQTNFFPGSTQKKDLLTGIADGIFTKLGGGGSQKFFQPLPVIRQALEEKNILIYLDNETLQKLIEDHGWAGRMVKVACAQKKFGGSQQIALNADSCFPDYLSVVEANLGVNKANYFINKSTVVEKKIVSDGNIINTVTISYENTNNTLVDQPQTYVNYLRVFVPYGSKLISVTLNNAPLAATDIDSDSYGGDKTVFGFLVKIAPENRGVVKISYTLPRLLSTETTSYQLFYQKQAGDKNSPLIFSLTYPDGLKLKPENFSSTSQRAAEIYYTTDTSVDRVFALGKE